MLVLALVVLSLQLVSNPNVVSANSAHLAPEANSPSIPSYQWQFLSPSEKAAVDASSGVIMGQRMMNVTLNVADASGVPYTGTVRVKQDSTSFIHAAGWPDGDWEEYLALTPSRSYTIIADWSVEEPIKGMFDFSGPDYEMKSAALMGMVNFYLNIGPDLGKCPGCPSLPPWAGALDYDFLKSAIQNYDKALVSHFKGRIQYYELWWEANAWYSNGKWPLNHIIDVIKMEALTIRSIDPTARICIDLVNAPPNRLWYFNEDVGTPGYSWTTEYFVQQMLTAGVPFDVIGLETHIGNGYAGHAGGIDTLYNRLIELAKFGKPLYIWEDGLGTYLDPAWASRVMGSWWWGGPWHGTPSEEKQAEYMVAETIVYLGNPSVLGVQWWALQDYPSDSFHMGVISYPDGARKKSFYAMEQLWNSLMVNETVQSINGVATFRGLAGNYSVSVEGYETEPSVIHVSDGEPNTFSLVLRSFALRDQASQTLSEVGSNLTATSGGVSFQSSEAKNLLNQSLDEYHTAQQMFQSKDYAAALQHAQKALDLVRQAYSKESEYAQEQQQQQRQQLFTRIAEIAVAVAVPVGCAVAAASYLRRRKLSAGR